MIAMPQIVDEIVASEYIVDFYIVHHRWVDARLELYRWREVLTDNPHIPEPIMTAQLEHVDDLRRLVATREFYDHNQIRKAGRV